MIEVEKIKKYIKNKFLSISRNLFLFFRIKQCTDILSYFIYCVWIKITVVARKIKIIKNEFFTVSIIERILELNF